MKSYFDEATDKRLLEAQTEEEVKAIIAETPEAEKLADKTELIMAELARIKGSVDNELEIDELDSAAGGSKLERVDLSPSQSCKATFILNDHEREYPKYCWSNDFCNISNEYEYHHVRWSNCEKGGKHDWKHMTYDLGHIGPFRYRCMKCGLLIYASGSNFDD